MADTIWQIPIWKAHSKYAISSVQPWLLPLCQVLWPRTCAWLEEAASNPQSAIDGTLCLHSSLEAGGLRTTTKKQTPRSMRRAERAQLDLQRIRAAIAADAELKGLVYEMLSSAFTAMAAGVRNHAAEFMPGGRCCSANITPELRRAMDGTPLTSVSAETMFARVKRRADRSGRSRHDTCMGAVLCERDGTVTWARGERDADGLLRQASRSWRKGSGKRTMEDERRLKGEAKAPEREAKLAKKRSGRAKKASELERLKLVPLATTYSALKTMRNDEISDQLKIYKLIEKKVGFLTTGTRVQLVTAAQSQVFEKFGTAANDLNDGDSGVEGRGVRRRKIESGEGSVAGGKKRKRSKNIVEYLGWEWRETEKFDIECLIGKMVAQPGVEVPGRTGVEIGTVLYKVLWKDFPPEIATWEEEDSIHDDFITAYEEGLEDEEGRGGGGSDSEEEDES